jgi:hypothetical protein
VPSLEGGTDVIYLPENHPLADQIKHSATALGLQAYRIFASTLADLHPQNNIIVNHDSDRNKNDPNTLCRPGNYLRLPRACFDQAATMYIAQRQYQGTQDRLVPIERLCDIGFYLGLMGKHYFEAPEDVTPENWRELASKPPEHLQLGDQKHALSFQCRITYAKKKPPMVVDPLYLHPTPKPTDPPVHFFTVGISQGAYPGEDNKLPIKDMCLPQFIDPDQAPHQVAFLTVPRNHLRGYMERKATERRAIKKKPAYAMVLSTDLIVQELSKGGLSD